MYSVMDTEGSVGSSVKERSFAPLWIACCSERQVRNEVKSSSFTDVLYVSPPCDMGVRKRLVSQKVVCYFHGVRCRICDVSCLYSPSSVGCDCGACIPRASRVRVTVWCKILMICGGRPLNEDTSQEETERQERCARGDAWRVAKKIY